MRYREIKLIALLVLALGLTGLKAQETIPAAGGNASGSGGSVSYTVGQIACTTSTGTSGSMASGVQQPYEISVVTGMDESTLISLNCTAYPNPTTGFLVLKIDGDIEMKYTASLYNLSGNLLKSLRAESGETIIDMSNLAVSVYFLKIAQTTNASISHEIKTFKIIKN